MAAAIAMVILQLGGIDLAAELVAEEISQQGHAPFFLCELFPDARRAAVAFAWTTRGNVEVAQLGKAQLAALLVWVFGEMQRREPLRFTARTQLSERSARR